MNVKAMLSIGYFINFNLFIGSDCKGKICKFTDVNTEYVILVDEQDQELGTMEKLQAHQQAKLHRAISVFVFNSNKELLLQKRAVTKYHSANLWTNTCCSHPKPKEDALDAAKRRLHEEMGLRCEIKYVFNFTYLTAFDNGLSEHEFDHVFFGFSDDTPNINMEEVAAYKYITLQEVENQLKQNPHEFTTWFKLIFAQVKNELHKIN